jgi:hypothetical protein
MSHRPSDEKFLRAAIKAGLRLQRNASSETGTGEMRQDGVATLQRIKASLRKQRSNLKINS